MTSKPSLIRSERFEQQAANVLQAINLSLPVDKRLYAHDLQGSRAHVEMLAEQNIISESDRHKILDGLNIIEQEITAGQFPFRDELEDIHMNIETRLIELIGPAGARLHTARSRNDQVVTAFRLWLRDHLDQLLAGLQSLIEQTLSRAEQHATHPMPGKTHLQIAQPITLGFHLSAYAAMLLRDYQRLAFCYRQNNENPLGSAAFAGTRFAIDRAKTTADLGFDRPMVNAMDAVSSRDFALSYLANAAILGTHLSRIGEEFTLWSTDAFGYIRFSDRFTTGSSIMPQKRNPDGAELIRAKAGLQIGHFASLAAVVKGLPFAYAKDLQEDKALVFACADSALLSVAATSGMMSDFSVNLERMRSALAFGFPTATDAADWLVEHLDLPFREAHRLIGALVKHAETANKKLDQLSVLDLEGIVPSEHQQAFIAALSIDAAISSRCSFGGTAPERVQESIGLMRKNLADLSAQHRAHAQVPTPE